jgi:hypothetical protein
MIVSAATLSVLESTPSSGRKRERKMSKVSPRRRSSPAEMVRTNLRCDRLSIQEKREILEKFPRNTVRGIPKGGDRLAVLLCFPNKLETGNVNVGDELINSFE